MRTKLLKSRHCASVVRVGGKWGNSKRSKEENLKKSTMRLRVSLGPELRSMLTHKDC